MPLFRKKPLDEAPGRRRPAAGGTDTSSRPSQAFSYYSQRSDSQINTGRRDIGRDNMPPVNREDRPTARTPEKSWARQVVLVPAAVVGLFLAGYLLFLSPDPNIILLQDKATAYFLQDASVYHQAAAQTLGSSLFNRDKVTIDTARVRLDLLKDYPEIQNVSVSLPVFGHRPQIYLQPYKPSFILTTTSSNAFLLDATGRALANASQITDVERLGVPTLQDHTGVAVKLGGRAIPSTTVSFAQTVVAALKQAQVTPSSLVLPPGAYELDVYISETPYYVKFNLQDDALQQAGTYLATRQRLQSDHVQPAQYIDVRVAGRSYYK